MVTVCGRTFYSWDEVADMTGINVRTVQSMYHKGILRGRPPRGLTRPVLFDERDVEAWLMGEKEDR